MLILNFKNIFAAIISMFWFKGLYEGFPHSSVGIESACNAGSQSMIPGWERSPGKGNGHPLQCSCLENSRDRGAWQATVHGAARLTN